MFVAGSVICILNFYLVLVREPLLRYLGRYDRHVSIVPVLGQLFAVLGMIIGWQYAWALWVGAALILLDMGGIHVALTVLAWHWVRQRQRE